MSHFDNSGSEDGQLRSPGDDYYSGEDHIDTADSLDIKPPQAARVSSFGRKKSGKEKKHSKEHKHKDRDRDRSERNRGGGEEHNIMIRDRQPDRSGGGSVSGGDERRHRHFTRSGDRAGVDHHRNHRRDYYDRGDQQLQQHQQQQDYHRHKQHGRDKRMERDMRERDRRKLVSDHHYDNDADAERALEDLRTRLLSKRHKYQKEIVSGGGHCENVSGSRSSSNAAERPTEVVMERGGGVERSERIQQYKREPREHKERSKNEQHIIEVIDSPEHLSDYHSSSSVKRKDKEKKNAGLTEEDSEQATRKAKLLEAEREMARRKEVAREELQARREKRREGSSLKRHHDRHNHKGNHRHQSRKRPKKSFEDSDRCADEDEILELSDNSEEESTDDDAEEETEDESATESESHHSNVSNDNVKSNQKQQRKRHKSPNDEEDDDERLPGSPLSIENLSKSEQQRRQCTAKSRSRSPSVVSRHDNSPHSEHSKSNHSSHLLSKSPSVSPRSRSDRSLTKSRSRSRSRSPLSRSRSRSPRSRSPLSDKEDKLRRSDDDDEDDDEVENDDIEMRDLEKSINKRKSGGGRGQLNEKGSATDDGDNKRSSLKRADDSPRGEHGEKLPNYYPGIQGCRSVEEFQCLNRIEEGTYGVVYRAKDKRTNEIVALKRLKMEKEKEGFPITSLREINTLLKGQHPNIVTVREIVVGSNMDKIFIVMDYVEHDLKSLMETMKHKEQSFFPGEVKCLTQQLLRAVAHLHDNWILHRDLKTSNLLLSHKGILKVGDFGLAREYGSPLKQYTSLVVTLWYRAPELLLCSKEYSTPIDMWSVGCIFAEFLQMGPLFPGKSEIDQLNRIFKELGTPNEKIWPGYKDLPAVQNLLSQNSHFTEYPVSNLRRRFLNKTTELGLNLLQGLLTYDPKQRLTAEQALKTSYFKELPLPIDPSMFPTWPAKSELGVRKALASSPKPPSGGSQFKQLMGRDDNITTTTSITSASTSSALNNNSNTTATTNNKNMSGGFVLNANIEHRQVAMAPGFNLKF